MTTTTQTATRTIPHSAQAEEAALGSVLINPDVWYDIAPLLTAGDFYATKHARIFDALERLTKAQRPLDFVTVCAELDQAGHLGEVGGAAYVSHLINVVPTAVNALAYAEIVRDMSQRRKIIARAGELARLAYDEARDVAEALTIAHKITIETDACTHAPRTMDQMAHAAYDAIAKRRDNPGVLPGVKMGIAPELDRYTKGLRRGGLSVLFGEPGHGKSALGFAIALNIARAGGRVVVFSLEMTEEEFIWRYAASIAGVELSRIELGETTDEEQQRVTNALAELADIRERFILIDKIRDVSSVRAELLRHLPDFVLIDHITLLVDASKSDNAALLFDETWRALKLAARETNAHIMAIGHPAGAISNRQDKHPTLGDLWFKGTKHHDYVFGLMRPHIYDQAEPKYIIHLQVLKGRGCDAGRLFELAFVPEKMQFGGLERHELNN